MRVRVRFDGSKRRPALWAAALAALALATAPGSQGSNAESNTQRYMRLMQAQ